MIRLATGFRVAAWRRRLEGEGIACYIQRRGDDSAGAILVKLATMDGLARLYSRRVDLMTGEDAWMVLSEGPEAEVDASARKQAQFDPDLWILEVEDRQGRAMLDALV